MHVSACMTIEGSQIFVLPVQRCNVQVFLSFLSQLYVRGKKPTPLNECTFLLLPTSLTATMHDEHYFRELPNEYVSMRVCARACVVSLCDCSNQMEVLIRVCSSVAWWGAMRATDCNAMLQSAPLPTTETTTPLPTPTHTPRPTHAHF